MKRIISLCSILILLATMVSGMTVSASDWDYLFEGEYKQVVDSAYTFAVVGDTQKLVDIERDRVGELYQWLVDIKDEKNLKFVVGVGDITDYSSHPEFKAAVPAIQLMDGQIPYLLTRGDHDDGVRYLKYFKYDSYVNQLDGMYKNVMNCYQTVTVGELDYLFMCLDLGMSDEALEWAAEIIEQHPNHNVIINTHGFINGSGKLLSIDGIVGAKNSATTAWERLVSQHPNIVMVVCGHVGTKPEVVNYEFTGVHGNKVQTVLVNPQRVDKELAVTGGVALFHISEDGKQVQVEHYATLMDKHLGTGVVFELNTIERGSTPPPETTTPTTEASTAPTTVVTPGTTVAPTTGENLEQNNNPSTVDWPLIVGCVVAAVVVAGVAVLLVVKKKTKK